MAEYRRSLEDIIRRLRSFLGEEELLTLVLAVLLLLKEKRELCQERKFPLQSIKQGLSCLPPDGFSPEAARCLRELWGYREIWLLLERLEASGLADALLYELWCSAQMLRFPTAAEQLLLRLGQALPFQRQRLLPFELTELMTALCGELPAGAELWDPYCGAGVLLTHAARTLHVTGAGLEKNRFAASFARIYFYLSTGRALSMPDSVAFGQEECRRYDAAISMIPAGPCAPEEEAPPFFHRNARHAEAARSFRIMEGLKEGGTAVLLVQNGVLFRKGIDLELRRLLVEKGWLAAVIYLPPRILFHTAVPSSILVFRKTDRPAEIRLFRPEDIPGWIQSGRQNQLTGAAVKALPAALKEWTADTAGFRLITAAEWEAAEYRLDPQAYFGGPPAASKAEKGLEELRRELWQAERDYIQAREELTTLIEKALPEKG